MAHRKILLHHVSLSKTIQAQKLNVLDYFKIIIKIFELFKGGTCGNTPLVLIIQQKNHIFFTSNNMYIVSQRMKMYFINFFFIQNSQLAVISFTCYLSNGIIKLFVQMSPTIKN